MNKIDIKNWKDFTIEDIFTIERPSPRSSKKYSMGEVPFVSSGNYHNGA